MDGWLALLGAFPVVVFAGLSVLALAYWLLVLLGAFDLDALDSVAGLAGKAHGAAEGAVDSAVSAVTGGVKGVSAFGEALAALGLARVPITISFTAFSLFGFLLSALTRFALEPTVGGALAALAACITGVGAGVGAALAVARPLAPIFAERAAAGGETLYGKTCRITIDVDVDGGQARVDEIIVAVRVASGTLARGEEAVIVERGTDGVFVVEPLKAHFKDEADLAAFARLAADAGADAAAAADADAPVAVTAVTAVTKKN